MMWQDYVIMFCIYGFVVTGFPLMLQVLRKGVSVTLYTAIPASVFNYIIGFTWLTFPDPLYISFTSSMCIATIWLVISVGSWRNRKKEKNAT